MSLHKENSSTEIFHRKEISQSIKQGFFDIFPLCLSVLPWGLLAGSMAIQTGLTFWQSVGMSAILFAGAAQLVTLGLIVAKANFISILITIFFLTAQHLLYSLTFRDRVKGLPLKDRLSIGFLLTDELFAVGSNEKCKFRYNKYYLISAGLTFYIFWNIFSLIGIYIAKSIPNLDQYHLDFSIVATFIAIIVPLIKNYIYVIGVIISITLAIIFHHYQINGSVVLAGIIGMIVCGCIESYLKNE